MARAALIDISRSYTDIHAAVMSVRRSVGQRLFEQYPVERPAVT